MAPAPPAPNGRRPFVVLAGLGGLGAVLLLVWSLGFAPRGFYSGDSGVKLIQANDLWAQGFGSRALLDDPQVNPGHRYHRAGGTFERRVAGQWQGIYSIAFVAPAGVLVGLFGMTGAQLVPALGGVLCALGLAWLLWRMRARPIVAGPMLLLALLGTPILFYSAQFFEHVPAAGFATVALAAAMAVGPRQQSHALLAGIAAACAGLLRPEGYCVVSALGLALVVQPAPLRERARRAALYLAGALPPLVAFWVFNSQTAGSWDPLVTFNHGSPSSASTLTMMWGEIFRMASRDWLYVVAVPVLVGLAPVRGRLRVGLHLGVAVLFGWLAWRAQVGSQARILSGLFTVTPLVALGLAAGPWSARTAAPWTFVVAFFAQVLLLERGGNGGGLQLGGRFFIPIIPATFALLAALIEDDAEALAARKAGLAVAALPALALAALGLSAELAGMSQGLAIARLGETACATVAAGPGHVVLGSRDWEAGILSPTLLAGKEIWISHDKSPEEEVRRIAAAEPRQDGFVYIGSGRLDVALPDGRRAFTTSLFPHDATRLVPVQYVSIASVDSAAVPAPSSSSDEDEDAP